MNDGNVFIHLQPTANELRRAFLEMEHAGTLRFLPESLRDGPAWMEYLHPAAGAARAISFTPVVIEVEGRYPAVFWLTDYCPMNRSAEIHFCAHGAYRLKTVVCACRLAVEMVLNSAEVDLLHAVYQTGDVRAERMARAFGFREYARTVRGCVYSYVVSENRLEKNYGWSKSEETRGPAESSRSGDTGGSAGSGGGRGGAPETSAATGAIGKLSGESGGGWSICKYAEEKDG